MLLLWLEEGRGIVGRRWRCVGVSKSQRGRVACRVGLHRYWQVRLPSEVLWRAEWRRGHPSSSACRVPPRPLTRRPLTGSPPLPASQILCTSSRLHSSHSHCRKRASLYLQRRRAVQSPVVGLDFASLSLSLFFLPLHGSRKPSTSRVIL